MNVSRTQDARRAFREMGATVQWAVPVATAAKAAQVTAGLTQAQFNALLEAKPTSATAIPAAALVTAAKAVASTAMSTGEKIAIAGGVLVVLAGGAYLLFFHKKRRNPRRGSRRAKR